MACHGIEALAADPRFKVVVMFNPGNKHLAGRLAEIPNIKLMEAPLDIHRLHGFGPDRVLCIQGDIGQSAKGVRTAKQAGIECIGYIAIPHRMAEMGAKFGSLRDFANQRLLNQPDRYIAISESMRNLLIERGVRKPISVVPNGISPPPAPRPPRNTDHGSRVTIGLMGRIEFNQKQQAFMVQTFCTHPEAFQHCRLLIAGNGPDEGKLRRLVDGHENILFRPWQDDVEAFYEQIDFLVIPSRYEGVPLVMLEALARGIPVIGSACDGMRDILPDAWTFEPGNAGDLAETFSSLSSSGTPEMAVLQQRILSEHSLEVFKDGFRRAICSRDR